MLRFIFLFFIFTSTASAVPYTLTYSGRLTNPNGSPVTGTVTLDVSFWDAETGGTEIHDVSPDFSVTLQEGVFTIDIELTATEFQNIFKNDEVWIEVKDGPSFFRKKFSVVPYSLKVPVDGTTISYNDSGQLRTGADDKGYLQPGTSSDSDCDNSREGQFRYNSASKQPEFCDGTNWVSMNASSSGVPTGTIAYFNQDPPCPSGWSEFSQAQGLYIVGLPSSGTVGSSPAGQTALSNLENRAVGQHTHNATQAPHNHTVTFLVPNNGGSFDGWGWAAERSRTTSDAQPAITVDNAGSVPGTNAPYIQLLVCRKD